MLSQTEKAFIVFVIIGGVYILTAIYNLASFFYLYLRTATLKKYKKNGNAWALVSGSSDGIGQAFAHELCARGFNIILHGRNPSKLSSVQDNLQALFPKSQFRLFVADAAAPASVTSAAIEELVTSIKDINLTVLVNNVGGAGNLATAFTTFQEHTWKEIDDMVSINTLFTLHLTHALLPFLARQPASLILNTGSTSHTGIPYLSVYSPTKGYLTAWGNALSIELQAEGTRQVEIMTVLSSNTQTGQDKRAETFFRPSSRRFAKAALNKVGCGKSVVVGYFGHGVEYGIIMMLPEWAQRVVLIMALKPYKGKKRLDS